MPKSAGAQKTGHVNLKKLAEHLQLSQTTVSLVLNNSPSARSIPPETRQRVLDAAKELDYRPNYFARSLRQSRSLSVGVLAPDLSEGYFTRVMSGVVDELTRAGYFYFTACHDWRPDLLEQYPRLLVERAVDGFLLLNTPAEIDVPVPVVAISAHGSEPNVTHIVLDHLKAAEMALHHLHQLGHRRIAFMRGPEAIPDSQFRWAGIEQAASALGLDIDSHLVTQIDSNPSSPDDSAPAGPAVSAQPSQRQHGWSPESGYHPMKQLLHARSRYPFTAIFCFNDIAAIGALRAIADHGLSVPNDISVVGFDDILSAAYSTPSLTTVRQPLNEMGRTGARILLERIAQPNQTELTNEILTHPELVIRESTGPAHS